METNQGENRNNKKNIFLEAFNIKKQCQSYSISLWQCPRFLFLINSVVIIAAIILTNLIAQRYITEPQLIALIILLIAAFLFVVGFIIVSSFERVAEASKTKSEFIAIMSHQLRTPLSAIKWQLNLLSEGKIRAENPETREFISHLDEENQRMIYMVNDLLELNRIEDKTFYLEKTIFDFKEIIEEIAEHRNRSLENTNISIKINSPEKLPLIFADRQKIRSVVSHIIDNAIRYSTNGGQIEIKTEILPKYIYCSVSDKGIGIPKKDIKRVFSKFFRAESAYNCQTQGLGIRLYLAKVIVEKSGGKIGFESKEGKGSKFWFTIPVSKK